VGNARIEAVEDKMGVTKYLYSWGYRYFRAPWDGGGPRSELVELVESGRISPCRAIDLGSGTGWNAIFLAQHGFESTGVDFAAAAIELGRKRAAEAGVSVNFVEDDLTNLRHVGGPFDLLVDYGTLDDLSLKDRDLYVQNVLPLTHPGTQFLLYCFEWKTRWWERPIFYHMACEPGEIRRRFEAQFEIERYAEESMDSWLMPGYAVYLMNRKGV
jgi:SAM-dependent methyltransferase